MTDTRNTVGPKRPSLDKIRALAESHVAYGWGASPGSHDRNILWTLEDSGTYMRFYHEARERVKQPTQRNQTCE